MAHDLSPKLETPRCCNTARGEACPQTNVFCTHWPLNCLTAATIASCCCGTVPARHGRTFALGHGQRQALRGTLMDIAGRKSLCCTIPGTFRAASPPCNESHLVILMCQKRHFKLQRKDNIVCWQFWLPARLVVWQRESENGSKITWVFSTAVLKSVARFFGELAAQGRKAAGSGSSLWLWPKPQKHDWHYMIK